MKLLFDENLSHRLADLLADDYPDCSHVRRVGLLGTDDASIWDFASSQGFIVVSKDSDFRQRSFLERPTAEGDLARHRQRRHSRHRRLATS